MFVEEKVLLLLVISLTDQICDSVEHYQKSLKAGKACEALPYQIWAEYDQLYAYKYVKLLNTPDARKRRRSSEALPKVNQAGGGP